VPNTSELQVTFSHVAAILNLEKRSIGKRMIPCGLQTAQKPFFKIKEASEPTA
jgi:hypothetical protein